MQHKKLSWISSVALSDSPTPKSDDPGGHHKGDNLKTPHRDLVWGPRVNPNQTKFWKHLHRRPEPNLRPSFHHDLGHKFGLGPSSASSVAESWVVCPWRTHNLFFVPASEVPVLWHPKYMTSQFYSEIESLAWLNPPGTKNELSIDIIDATCHFEMIIEGVLTFLSKELFCTVKEYQGAC